MVDAKLVIYDPTNSDRATDVPITVEIPVSITLAIADIRDPDKRNSSFSKTLTLPGTKTLNKLFEHIYNITTELNNFNPNLKTRCEYYVKTERVFTGDIQLLKIRKSGKPYVSLYYECSIVGRLANVFIDLGNALLTDLDFSDLNHVFQYSNRNWTPTLGTGYVYNLADYGVNGGKTSIWDFAHLKPAIFEKEYIDRIFASIGKTYTSSYLTSTYEESIIIPDNNEGALKMSASQVNGVSFYAGKTADSNNNIPLTYSGIFGGGWIQANSPYAIGVTFNDDSTPPFYNGGGYSTGTSAYTSPVGMNFAGKTRCDFEIRVNAPGGTTSMVIAQGSYTIDVIIIIPFVGTYTSSVNINPGYGTLVPFTVNVDVPTVYINTNDIVYVSAVISGTNLMQTSFYNGGTPITVGTATIDLNLQSTSWFSGTTADQVLPIGYTVVMNNTVPKNIKQIDFLMSVIKSENLYMELDLTDSNNYIIERRPDFFLANSQALDWTLKWDFMREDQIVPMGELDFRKYIFAYKTDGDKYNKLYKEAYGETYAQRQIDVENDFIKNEKKTELIFAATPMVGNAVNSLVYPVFAQANGLTLKPMATQIRRLYWGGTVQLLSGFYGMVNALNGATPTNLAIYPFAGTVDDPYAPTLSIDWDVPNILYYSYPGQTWTTNNLYVRNYQSFIEQITDVNSKIVIKWMYLTANDIASFTFRNPIWIDDSYFLVNKIYDYDPQQDSPVKVEFLRLSFVNDPVPEGILIWENGEGETSGTQYGIVINQVGNEPNGLNSNSDGISLGENNINQGSQSGILGGYNNSIGGIIENV